MYSPIVISKLTGFSATDFSIMFASKREAKKKYSSFLPAAPCTKQKTQNETTLSDKDK